jgi:hypothetical protein
MAYRSLLKADRMGKSAEAPILLGWLASTVYLRWKLDPLSSVKSFIVDHYVPVERVGSWLVLRRINSASTLRRDDQK